MRVRVIAAVLLLGVVFADASMIACLAACEKATASPMAAAAPDASCHELVPDAKAVRMDQTSGCRHGHEGLFVAVAPSAPATVSPGSLDQALPGMSSVPNAPSHSFLSAWRSASPPTLAGLPASAPLRL